MQGAWRVWGILLLALVWGWFAPLSQAARCLLVFLACGCALGALFRRRGAVICPEVEHLVGQVTGVAVTVDQASKGVSYGGPLPAGGAVRRWLDAAILKFGRMNDTPADRRVLRLWLAEEMKRNDMRDADAVRLIPTVVEFMFIPGVEELLAKLVRDSCAKQLLKDLAGNQPG